MRGPLPGKYPNSSEQAQVLLKASKALPSPPPPSSPQLTLLQVLGPLAVPSAPGPLHHLCPLPGMLLPTTSEQDLLLSIPWDSTQMSPPPKGSPPHQLRCQKSPPHPDTVCTLLSLLHIPLHSQEFFVCLRVGNRSLQVTSVSLAPITEPGTPRSFQ